MPRRQRCARLTALPRFRSERRIVILISDGLDNASTTKAGAAIKAALEKQISFYVIHFAAIRAARWTLSRASAH